MLGGCWGSGRIPRGALKRILAMHYLPGAGWIRLIAVYIPVGLAGLSDGPIIVCAPLSRIGVWALGANRGPFSVHPVEAFTLRELHVL